MILVCPSCAASHEIARVALGETGLQVRCPHCGAAWFASTHSVTTRATNAALAGLAARQAEADEPTWLRRLFHVTVGLAGILAVCGSLMTAIAKRDAIVRAVPALGSLYAAIGLPVLHGLELRNVKSTLLFDSGGHVLAVVGEIANLEHDVQPVPALRVALRGADGRDIYSWTATAPKSKLNAGETVAFRTRLAAPPEGAQRVVIQFADRGAAHVEDTK
jgi:predicted Zn finger-like uncharacterized protein